MSVKLIAMDLDGTLMMPDHLTVSQRTKSALMNAHNMGVKTVISTGRTQSVVKNVVEQIPFVDYVMYSDGAGVFDVQKNKTVHECLIPFETVRKIVEFLNTLEVFYNIYMNGKIVTQKGRLRYYFNSGLPQEFVDNYMKNTFIYDDMLSSIEGKSAELVVGFFNDENDFEKANEFMKKYTDSLYITSAMKNEFEMTNILATKGKTLEFLCQNNSFFPEEVMAVGDSLNDIPMLDFAGISVSMGNADNECRLHSKYVTDTNKNDGVAKAIEKFVLKN